VFAAAFTAWAVTLVMAQDDPAAAPAPVPQTGQTKSYHAADDGDLKPGVPWPKPRFADNGDGTVTDRLTGLMWAKAADLGGDKTWNEAVDSCGALELAGHADWRLPSINELESLVDCGRFEPAVPSDHPFEEVQDARYWSSTTYANDKGMAWFVDMTAGGLSFFNKWFSHFVWPVRGPVQAAPAPVARTGQTVSHRAGDDGDLKRGVPWPEPRFVDHGDGTVSDLLTGLMWTKDDTHRKDETPPEERKALPGGWAGIVESCGNLTFAGYKDWRLPTLRELRSLVDYGRAGVRDTGREGGGFGGSALPAGHPFIQQRVEHTYLHRTSTTKADEQDVAWAMRMNRDGGVVSTYTKEHGLCAWPVRGPVGPDDTKAR
jgi:hypothetical protein